MGLILVVNCEEISLSRLSLREKKTEKNPSKAPEKNRKKQQKDEGGHANKGDIQHQIPTYLDPLVFSTGMDLLHLPGADRG